MSDVNLARRTEAEISFAGTDITKEIMPYLTGLTYTDNEADEADDLQIQLQDRDGLWLEDWLTEAVQASAAAKLSINAKIRRLNWFSDGKDDVLSCGAFELDGVDASGPPAVVTIKATALPFSESFRQTKKSRAWESYKLSGIASELAGKCGLKCMYEAKDNPFYKRVEQSKTSDAAFLSKLCKDAGISMKVTDGTLVLFDRSAYEKKTPVLTIKKADVSYTKYKLSSSAAETRYAACRVSYISPATGKCIEGTAKAADYDKDAKDNQQLEITARVSSVGEAKALAAKRLKLHNCYSRAASFTLPGNPSLVAGVTVRLEGFGGWDGKYMVSQAKHSVKASGYTTDIQLRRCLEG